MGLVKERNENEIEKRESKRNEREDPQKKALYRKLHAFIYDAVVLDYQAGQDGECAILTVGKWFSKSGYAFGFQKSSKYVAKVDQFMLRYQQNGDLERLQNFWLTGACSASKANQKTHSVPLGIENFISAFVLLATGTVMCVVLLGFEYIYSKCLYSKLAKVDKSGWCGLLSMSMGRSLDFADIIEEVAERYSDDPQAEQRERQLATELSAAKAKIRNLQFELEGRKSPRNDGKASPKTKNSKPDYESSL